MIARIQPRQRARIFLKEWRLHRDLTQEQLAEIVGSDKGTLSKWENGKRAMNTDILSELAWALRCTVPQLYAPPDEAEQDELFAKAPADVRQLAAIYIKGILDGRK